MWLEDPRWPSLVRKAMSFPDGNYLLARHVFSKPVVANHPKGAELLLELIKQQRAEGDIVHYILSEPTWAQNARAHEIIEELQKLGTVAEPLARALEFHNHWSSANTCALSLHSN